ncbi:XRE family transcriptional regulator [Acinetobacter sp. HY1485]|uniref:XRE family transcriptional regulator n=1 Tax=Acinetobacter sp. HY1485 TaxID=2970918 RepID=UPI0022B9CC9C|nr:XRE family transcriptional regulator [Acinetobacter sp. HY1485]
MSVDQTLKLISENVKYYRHLKNMSQQQLADAAQMSRRMLAALENNNANISLTKLDMLAQALDIKFSDLIENREMIVWQKQDSKGIFLGAAPAQKEAELWLWTLMPDEKYNADADPKGYSEIIYIIEGELNITQNQQMMTLKQGETKIITTTQDYTYANKTSHEVRFIRNVVY